MFLPFAFASSRSAIKIAVIDKSNDCEVIVSINLGADVQIVRD